MEQVPKKGMSKGCMVGLIVAGVILLLVIIAAVTCYMKREDLAKFGATTIVGSLKSELRKNPIEGADTTRFFALSDEFAARLAKDTLDYNKYSRFMVVVQAAMQDKKIDADEVRQLTDAILVYYPDLNVPNHLIEQQPADVSDSNTASPVDTTK